jgi:hypothetical protein
MSFNKAIVPAVELGEEPFSIDEIFYSRTDKRGVIRSGNEVFRRVSGFDWGRLIGAPHRVVRHPDMPRAVFWLLWKTIQDQRPMVAFVKNCSASGRWYWVLAVVVPLDSGYLSVRIKPSTELLEQVKALYAEVLAAEATLSPEQSADLLATRLTEMGFAGYDDFAALVLQKEPSAREAALGRDTTGGTRVLAQLADSLTAMRGKQAVLLGEFEALQSIPTNMRIIASRLEPSGGPISAISDNYKFASAEISRQLEEFAGNEKNLCQAMASIVRDAVSISAIARLMAQLRRKFDAEARSDSPVDVAEEQKILLALETDFARQASQAMQAAERVSGELNLSSGEIRRMMLGLDTIRVMGRVESGRLGAAGLGLSSAIDQLDTRHAAIAAILQELMDLSTAIKTGISSYQRHLG